MTNIPLLLLHGLRGSQLVLEDNYHSETIWKLANENHPLAYLLALHQNGDNISVPAEPGTKVSSSIVEAEMHEAFIKYFSKERQVIVPAIDWRLSPTQAMEQIRRQFPTDKEIDIVTHSLGMYYLAAAVELGYLDLGQIRKLALVTPPFGGSLDILNVLLSGYDRNPETVDHASHAYGMMVRTFPALYRLLPEVEFEQVQDESAANIDLLDVANWPPWIFGPDNMYRNVFADHLLAAKQDKDKIDDFYKKLSISKKDKLLIIAANGMLTPKTTILDNNSGELDSEFDYSGDGRLLIQATRPADLDLKRVVIGDRNKPIAHGAVLTSSTTLQILKNWFNNGVLAEFDALDLPCYQD
jgi:pimeloyl-ACP methyl ester carboxylesterase